MKFYSKICKLGEMNTYKLNSWVKYKTKNFECCQNQKFSVITPPPASLMKTTKSLHTCQNGYP